MKLLGTVVRCLHFSLTLGIYTLLLNTPSDLNDAWTEKKVSFFVLTVLMMVSLIFYLLASLLDPGYLTLEHTETIMPTRESAVKFEQAPANYCRVCRHIKPLRTKHCYTCGRCVRKFDHHCPWLGNCVGERNHRWFLLFLSLEVPLTSWAALITWHTVSFSQASQLMYWLTNIVPRLMCLVFLSVSCVMISLLCVYHCYLMVTGQTTWEQASHAAIPYLRDSQGNPFDQGCLLNVTRFLCADSNWEHVSYQRTDQQLVNIT